jgi:hypothetical protein
MRSGAVNEIGTHLRKLLIELADRGCCDDTIAHRFKYRRALRPELTEWYIDRAAEGEPVTGLQALTDATLVVLMLGDRTSVHQFTAHLRGTTQAGASWLVAAHLDATGDDHMGSGACGHASFHSHVGPDYGVVPEVRVPLPAVGPVAALDWIFSIVVPGWEPAPWPDVVADLSAAVKGRKP